VILPVRESAPFYRRSSHVNLSNAVPRSAAGGFVPPQVTIVSAKPSTAVMMMIRSLGTTEVHPRISGDDVLYWRSDII